MKIYSANPLGFSESGRLFLKEKIKPMLIELGFEILDPWKEFEGLSEEEINKGELSDEERLSIGKKNEEMLEKADIVLAILDGPDVDSGTSAEIGYAYAKGKRVIGYRGDLRKSGEDIVNLQIETFIIESGGKITRSLNELKEELWNYTRHLNDKKKKQTMQ
ncbi:MAG: nucleoside 2-deoxyribosyltransferase [Candidatus Micrarchaeia archaeon]